MLDSTPGTLFLRSSQIVVIFPDGTEKRIPLMGMTIRIGRGTENNDVALPVTSKSISRRHLEIRFENGDYRVYDLGSGNGIWVNGVRVETTALKDGDEITIGQHADRTRIQFLAGTELLASQESVRVIPEPPNLLTTIPQGIPALALRLPNGRTVYFAIQKDPIVAGRATSADLVLPYQFVSSHHFELRRDRNDFTVTDLVSTNGTLLNNKPLNAGKPMPIHHDDIIRIGDDSIGISLGVKFINPAELGAPHEGFSVVSPAITFMEETITIGRSLESNIRLNTSTVSRHHAAVRKLDGVYILEDLGSRNGTYVNDQLVKRVEIHNGDIIRISDFILIFNNGSVTQFQSHGMRLDVLELSKDVSARGGKLRIMDNISMSVLPREFIGLVGGSGAGKSTLLNALVGIRPGSGQVKLNGQDFYHEYEQFRAQLGYVPQTDILHTVLTVEKALDYTARLRLPASLSAEERKQRISAVLETVSMNTATIRKMRISKLSGGQRKRVSIAAELLADPKLIYLDEATSGLDPGLEKKMMYTLRRMADEGRTVVLITHATDNIVQTDHVAFLSQGRLVFFGPSPEALNFFEVDDFADIYEKIDRSGEHWRKTYEEIKPDAYQKYVLARQSSARATPKREIPRVRFGLGDFFRQFVVLSQRFLNVLLSDPITLMLMLLLLPLTGVLQLVIGSRDILTGNLSILADPVAAAKTLMENYTPYAKTNTFVFVMGLEAVLTGLFVPSNDLVKERSIFLRERMVNLKVSPYLLSKAAIYTIFVIIQVALYILILSLGVDFPKKGLFFPGVSELFITLFLTMMAGITFGFILSAISRNTEMAIYLLTMMLFFQFFFAGTVFDLRGNAFEPFSYLSTTRWSLTALGVTIDMPVLVESTILCSEIPTNPLAPKSPKKTVCENYPDAKKDLMIDYGDEMLLKSWGVLAGMCLLFLTVTGVLLARTKAD